MRWALLAAGCLMTMATGPTACSRCRRLADGPWRPAYVADEVLVRIPVLGAPPGGEGTLLAKLQHLFGPPRDSCCRSGSKLTYRFGVGDRSVEQAVAEARALDPARVWAQPNFVYTPDKTPSEWTSFNSQWSLDNPDDTDINAPEAWEEVTGDSRVAVAIVDSGVAYENADLEGRVWKNDVECPGSATGSTIVDDDGNGYIDDCYGIDAPNAVLGGSAPAPDANADKNDHGTAVAGIAAAAGDNDTLMVGVSWDARIVICKFFEGALDGTTFNLEECLRYVLELNTKATLDHLVAVNMSWSTSRHDDLVYCAIDDLRREGVLAVASAGNFGDNNDQTPHYPASYFLPNVIAVAEMDDDDTLLKASNRGARSVHTAAPGEVPSLGLGDKLKAFGGTSGAAPHVTGLLALLEARDLQNGSDDFDWRALKNLVLAGGKPLEDLDRKVISRRRLRAWDKPTPSPGGTPNGTAPRIGSLTCRQQFVQRRLRPLENHTDQSGRWQLLVAPGTSLLLAAISIDCEAPAGPVEARAVETSGSRTISIPLNDGDLGHGQADGDGVFTADWTPPADMTEFVLTYHYGSSATEIADDAVTVRVVTNAPPGEPQQTLRCPPEADSPQP